MWKEFPVFSYLFFVCEVI